MAVPLTVQIFKNEQLVDTKQFDRDLIKIGRLSSAHLRLDDSKISRIHAVIEVGSAEDNVSIIDMGSTQGTLVNGNKVSKTKLNNGDQVVVGESKLVVYIGAGAAAAVQAPVTNAAPVQQPIVQQPGMVAPQVPVGTGLVPGAAGVPPQPMAAPQIPVQQQPMAQQPSLVPGAAQMPRFDGSAQGAQSVPAEEQRISAARLSRAAVESKSHPALPPEDRMTTENRSLEMRVYWGQILLDIRHYIEPKQISIGESKGNVDVFITSDGLPTEVFPIVRFMNDKYMLTFTDGMEGEFDFGDGSIQTFEELRRSTKVSRDDNFANSFQIDLPTGAKGIVHWAGMTFAFRFVPPPRRIKSSPFKQLDLNYLQLVAISFCLHIAFIIMAYVYPYETKDLNENLFNEPDRWGKLILQPPEATQETEDLLKKIKEKMQKKKEKPEEKPEEKVEQKVVKKVVKKTREERKKEVAKKFERLFDSSDDGGNILGGGGGGSLAGTLSNVIGTMGSGTATAGLAGLGIRGSGPMTGGGVGTSKGIGGIGLLGGGGKGAKYKVGMKKKKQVQIEFDAGPTVSGGLTKRDIKKVIKKNRNQIRYCYELGLQINKELEGRIKIHWIISAAGSVISAEVAQSDIGAKAVEMCIVTKIRGWKFPEPKGGGIVEVNYPFIFKQS